MNKKDYDAVVIGSGPNGLAAAITMQQAGLSVLILEAKSTIGGGLRCAEFTLPGFIHDICSSIHPLAVSSPLFRLLPLQDFGLEYVHPTIAVSHPFDDSTSAAIFPSVIDTARALGKDEHSYLKLINPLVTDWDDLSADILAPLHFPRRPVKMARFGLDALTSASHLCKRFETKQARGLWAGMAAHAIQPLTNLTTSAIALVLIATAHTNGWPFPKGGCDAIAKALGSYFKSLGGKIETNFYVSSLNQIPSANAILFDVTPRQLLQIAGHKFSSLYKWQLEKYRYGMGVFKIDWALDKPIPFLSSACRSSGTVHIGNTFEEIAASEQFTSRGNHPEKPFVLLTQQSLFDPSRCPEGKQSAWAYCHVPNGSQEDMTERIERQVERFAPGFRERILARHVMNTAQMEEYNPNYIGGDINGGIMDAGQLFTRPVMRLSPYNTSAKGIYICSSSSPPGGGVHGMCGYYAAKKALKEIFNIQLSKINK